MRRADLTGYFSIMESFLHGRTGPEDFEASYLSLFKADNRKFPETIFGVLNKLFSDVDMFVSDPSIRGEGDLDGDQLLERVRVAHSDLDKLVRMRSV